MSRKTLFVLAALVIALGALAWWQVRVETSDVAEADVPLFEGVDPGRVTFVRVEDLQREQHVKFERDASGRWRMTEPIQIEADQAIAQLLLDSALARRCTPVPEAERDEKSLGFDPPRAILEIEEDVGGTRRRQRVELGALDLDGQRINVRARGRLLRTWRDLDTTIDRQVDDFMTHDALDVSPHEVLELHRGGSLVREDGRTADVGFDAMFERGEWRATAPVSAPLDPQAASLWLRGVTGLRVDAYVDHGRRLWSDFGLDPPEMTVSLVTLQDKRATLRFGRMGGGNEPRSGRWFCAREGQTSVWTVDPRAVELVAAPIEEMLDRRIVRLPREAIDGAHLVHGGRYLQLWREEDRSRGGRWMVKERPDASSAFGRALPADAGRVEDLLGRLEQGEIAKFLPGVWIELADVRASFVIHAGGQEQGAAFGREQDGAVLFQRHGDAIAGLVDPALLELLATPATELWSLQILELAEIDQVELELRGRDGVARKFRRGSKGLWTRPETEVEARELRDVLDPLFFVRATRHLGLGPHAALADSIEVRFTSTAGALTRYAVGLASDAAAGETTQIDLDGERAVLKDQDLHRRLRAVLDKGP